VPDELPTEIGDCIASDDRTQCRSTACRMSDSESDDDTRGDTDSHSNGQWGVVNQPRRRHTNECAEGM